MKLLLVDDHALFRSGVRLLVQQRGEAVSIVEASTAQDGLDIAQSTNRPDLVLLDLNLPGLDGASGVAKFVSILSPRVPVVVVSGEDESASSDACLAAGAVEFVHKSSSPERLERVLDKYLLSSTPHTMSTSGTGPLQLTPRQMEVLKALAQGLPNKEIARALNVSPNTIKVHLAELFRLLSVNTRTMAVVRARDGGLIRSLE